MNTKFSRSGPLMDPEGYPEWLREIIRDCGDKRRSVVEHEIFQLMSEDLLPAPTMRYFLCGIWSVIEEFPQYMAMNLLKVKYGSVGHEMARKYLIRNIRVEQNHAEYWIDWAEAHGVTRAELLSRWRSSFVDALSHWCWHTCERDPLAVAMAATNYAIEGVTGEWAARVASGRYESGFPPDLRKKATKWLRVHADYDDQHPWEALEIIASLLGTQPPEGEIESIQMAILKSFGYMYMALDDCLAVHRSEKLLDRPPALACRGVVLHTAH